MLFGILIGALILTWATIGVLVCIGDDQHRAGWRQVLRELERRHG
ncbi:hypothetical protein KSF_095560 [Reticulibacter mediterranei]|uniref:Uncharacterized protein n=1 Tax=Reticulibacter mediterranei TaxID=2778369 RepID=A0A8J3IVV5_9CHLR|nr:hypothetical protein [Reticulibacter mediterranei]GHO99508.1 hypothetical protein KSF_095560 [Reticulibacter mediterranei]